MSITKPFTFVAGTKARANEVNQNFDVLYSQVNSNISAINTNANDIDTLDSNKANVNGSSSQRFACADPTSQSDAVNKQSMVKAIGNSINYIDGYVISKDSGSPNNTILVTAGSCYDYTKTVVLVKDTSTTKQNISQGASTTYYVYVIGNDSGSSVDILISSSAVTPALPEGYTKFRQIGNYTTDNNSHIATINNLSNSLSFGYITDNILPDYSRAVSFSPSSGQVVGSKCWLQIYVYNNETNGTSWCAINGKTVASCSGGSQGGIPAQDSNMVLVNVNDTMTYGGTGRTFLKIPFVGGGI